MRETETGEKEYPRESTYPFELHCENRRNKQQHHEIRQVQIALID